MPIELSLAHELRILARQAGCFEPFELPDVVNRLWNGKESNAEWRHGNLPYWNPQGSFNHITCEECGTSLVDVSCILWMTPTGICHPWAWWTNRGIHFECPEQD